MEIEIYFNDLVEEMKEKLLSAYNINSPEEMNLDITPLTTIYIDEED